MNLPLTRMADSRPSTPTPTAMSRFTPTPTLTRIPYRQPTPDPTQPPPTPHRHKNDYRNVCGPSERGPRPGKQLDNFLHWASDGYYLIFGHAEKIWRVGLESGELVEIVDVNPVKEGNSKGYGMAYGFYASLSPDGSQIVYSTCQYKAVDFPSYFVDLGERTDLRYEIAIINIDGGEQRRLTENFALENYPAWSPDGKKVAYLYWGPVGPLHISYVGEAGILDLGHIVIPIDILPYPPVWSPDGQRLAFLSLLERVSLVHGAILQTVKADGSEIKSIGEATTLPTWSPDSTELAFAGPAPDGKAPAIYAVKPDGSDRRIIWNDENDGAYHGIYLVSWSPSGSELLFLSDDLYTISLMGKDLRRVFQANNRSISSETIAEWSPDGSRIAVYHPDRELTIMDRDGTQERTLVVISDDGTVSTP